MATGDAQRKAKDLKEEARKAAAGKYAAEQIAKQSGDKVNLTWRKPEERKVIVEMVRSNRASDTAKTATRAKIIAEREEPSPVKKGTQPGHHVTDSKNHTKTIK